MKKEGGNGRAGKEKKDGGMGEKKRVQMDFVHININGVTGLNNIIE